MSVRWRARRPSGEAGPPSEEGEDRRVRLPLFLSLVLLATFPLILLSGIQSAIYMRDKRTAASGRLAEAAETLSKRIDEFVAEHRRAIVSCAETIVLGNLLTSPSLNPWLARQHVLHPGFLTMIVTDEEGRLIAAHPARGADGRPVLQAGLTVVDRPYFQEPMRTGRPYISDVFRGRGFGRDPIVAVSAPLVTGQGERRGIVEGSLDLSALQRFSGTFHRMEGVEIVILDLSNRVIFATPGSEYAALTTAPELAALADPSSVRQVEIGGVSYLLASSRSELKGWRVLVRRPWRTVRRAIAWGYGATMLGVLGAALLSGVLGRMIARWASRPLRRSQRRYRELVNQSFGLICTHDLRGVLLMVNPAAAELLGYRPEELVGKNLGDLLTPAAKDQFGAYLSQLVSGGSAEGLMEILTRWGEERVWMYRNRLVEEEERAPYVLGSALDITERKRAEEALKQQALRDALTGLANRALFLDRLQKALDWADRHRRQTALLYLDLDGFKQVNDAAGHSAGDWLLREVAARLTASVRKVDTVARLGGDELAVILTEITSAAIAEQLADVILQRIAEPYLYHERPLTVTASLGISLYPQNASSLEALLQDADRAMYEAKGKGKNRYHLSRTAAASGRVTAPLSLPG